MSYNHLFSTNRRFEGALEITSRVRAQEKEMALLMPNSKAIKSHSAFEATGPSRGLIPYLLASFRIF